ncbi:MFS transporter, MHS family, proline/betaine transporter [Pseudonocardia ammonioxydans]|uniref:Putative proline/betaine transporter n=1 Tax=Pseudonocardia ammonioxydans TaxID=260086 RepID=A0A1I5AB36_PSUAM|nr:MFS transporter [Pseudonocardia ammonioxydans]SFN59369.1 MFS transporter, MHS family, proline/betaine transporter [Pseudonocardia ammonioxydans]
MGAAAAGNILEWFDFALYGFFAVTIGQLFFPSSSPTASLLAALAVFGVAFVMRPLGGIVLGRLADRAGRRPALTLSVLLMGVSTTLIACLPSHASIGVAAPLLLVALRCVQGFSAGGEYAGATTYLLENAPSHRRGLWSSVISATSAIGVLLAGIVALAATAWLTEEQVTAWGWRLPFLLAAPLAVVGLYIRYRLEDTPVYQELERRDEVPQEPLRSLGRSGVGRIGLVFAATAVAGLGFYYLATYVVTHLTTVVGLDRTEALLLAVAGLAIYSLVCPLAGMSGDRWGRRPTIIVGGLGLAVVAVPSFLLIGSGVPGLILLGLTVFAVFEALANVMLGLLLVELFPARTRVSGSAIGFNLAQAAVGGPGPLVAAALAAGLGLAVAPAFYVVAVALLATAALVRYLPETRGTDLVTGATPAARVPAAGDLATAEETR